ncbi:hypothetical protein [Pedobacter mucosus]|uniref:hypothetical protein n=1 Tax=Pedobacter mucosus TaxID=2895286 RepID=UPI001EE4712E|nr:hypothetical protein [Pedobacter mucosus]UKT64861.1 hypothetical protein LOK61_03600 [Pedobacter mucosus]
MQQKESSGNHEAVIVQQAENFINSWFKQSIDDDSLELSELFILPKGKTLDKQLVVNKIRNFFEPYPKFVGGRFDIIEADFELTDSGKGFGYAEGALGYRAVLNNAESKIIGGPFKIYFALQNGNWKIVNIDFPGFEL